MERMIVLVKTPNHSVPTDNLTNRDKRRTWDT